MSSSIGHSFGAFTQSQTGTYFSNFRGTVRVRYADTYGPNDPDNPSSPNHPRKDRPNGYLNPILGDDGNGKIGRWQEVKIDALEELRDMMIEMYLKDKDWYALIRCREALWNMYRKVAWYVRYEKGDDRADYRQALNVIKDWIYKIEHPEKSEQRLVVHEIFTSAGVTAKGVKINGFDYDKELQELSVHNKLGSCWLVVKDVETFYEGEIRFFYGGFVQKNDAVEVYRNGTLVWSDQDFSEEHPDSLTAIIPLHAGEHEIRVVYRSEGGVTNPHFWLSDFRITEKKPVLSKYQIGLVDMAAPPSEVVHGLDLLSTARDEEWEIANNTATVTARAGEVYAIEKQLKALTDESYISFEYGINELEDDSQGFVHVYFNDVYVDNMGGAGTIRQARYAYNQQGTLKVRIEVETDRGAIKFSIRNLEFTEVPENEKSVQKYQDMQLPVCPAPYVLNYGTEYYNHFADSAVSTEMLSTAKMKMSDFPGFLRYVSSSEEQEWDLVHSLNGVGGTENIFKMDLEKLSHGNTSKIMTVWKFKHKGTIKFKYLASVPKGNGLVFFINDGQVGGEWHSNEEWQEVTYNVQEGQAYKFDWLVRRKEEVGWGKNAVFIKDLVFTEVVPSSDTAILPKPKGQESYGSWYYGNDSFIWGAMQGDKAAKDRVHTFSLTNDGDGDFSLSFTLGTQEPTDGTNADPFSSRFILMIDGVIKGTYTQTGVAQTVSFPITKGRHTYAVILRHNIGSTTLNNWDYVKVDWVRSTGWLESSMLVTPYCEKGKGDKCVEALIQILLYARRGTVTQIGSKIWLFT